MEMVKLALGFKLSACFEKWARKGTVPIGATEHCV
jgi:hypothetical protein